MTLHFLRTALQVLFALAAAVLVLQIAKRKVIVAGRFVSPKERPLSFWLWLAFDVLAVWFVARLVIEFGGSLWP